MANPQGTNTKPLQTFLNLQSHEQMAIVLKTEGKTYEEIVGDLKQEFNKDYSVQTIKWWFMAGGKLEQAYLDYLEELGNEAIKEGKLLIRRGTRAAATTLISKLKSNDETIQVRAALGLLNKYVPDKQQIISGMGGDDDELPEELVDKGDDVVLGKGGGDGNSPEPAGDESNQPEPADTKPVDEPQQGQTADESAGNGSGESVPEEVLQEPNPADGSSDTPT